MDVYLLSLRGHDNDYDNKLVDAETWAYVMHDAAPTQKMADDLLKYLESTNPADGLPTLIQGNGPSDRDRKERAMAVAPSTINGRQHGGFCSTLSSVMAAAKRNNLNIVETFEGPLW